MSTNFPAALDTFVDPNQNSRLSNPPHSAQHANANDAIAALEAKVGVTNSTDPTSLDYKVNNAGSAATVQGNLSIEVARAQAAETAVQANLNAENARAIGTESGLQSGLNAEISRATTVELTKTSTLIPTAVNTGSYNPQANDFAKYDTTGGSSVGLLPTAPPDKTQIGVKMVAQTGTNTVTISAGGSDKFNIVGGGTTATLRLLNQAMTFQYQTAGNIWNIIDDDLPLSQLDARYNSATPTGIFGGNSISS